MQKIEPVRFVCWEGALRVSLAKRRKGTSDQPVRGKSPKNKGLCRAAQNVGQWWEKEYYGKMAPEWQMWTW